MATSTCVKCGNTTFEATLNTPRTSNYKLIFVQCAGCGGVAGVLDYHNVGALLYKLAKKLGVDLDA